MFTILQNIFNPNLFGSHGEHFANAQALLWTIVTANIVTFISYMLIPAAIIYFIRRRKDLVFTKIFWLFSAFIVLCGLHHLIHVLTFWYGLYYLEAIVDMLTAVVSIGTFFALLPVLPAAIKLRSLQEQEDINQHLVKEVQTRREIEQQLIQKNQELEQINKLMVGRELKMVELKKEIQELKKNVSPK